MNMTSDLVDAVSELKRCGEILIGISDTMTKLFSNDEEDAQGKQPSKVKTATKIRDQKEKPIALEDVRAVLADKSRKGFTAQVKELLTKHGAEKLSDIDPTAYKALLADAEVIGNG